MKLFKNKKFYVSVFIDLSFLVILFLFSLFIFYKMQSNALMLQSVTGDLANLESIAQENASMFDYSLLVGNMEVLNQAVRSILVLFFVFLVGGFILYCLFQSLQWSFILNKLKDYRKYLYKFSLISFLSVFLSFLLFSSLLRTLRDTFLGRLEYLVNLEGVSLNYGLIVKFVLLLILLLVLIYYTTICYVFLGENKIIDSLKKSFKFRDKKSILVYIICLILILLIFYLFSILGLYGLFWVIIEFILILGIVNYFRYSLIRIL